MPPRDVIAFGEAIHTFVEQAIKKEFPMKLGRAYQHSAAQDEALRLRLETAEREQGDFARKVGIPYNADDDEDVEEGDEVTQVDYDTERFLCPTLDEQVNEPGSSLTGQSIMRELFDDGIPPFVPGPIGMIQNHTSVPAPSLTTHNQIKEDERAELRKRQKRNDRKLSRLARRYT